MSRTAIGWLALSVLALVMLTSLAASAAARTPVRPDDRGGSRGPGLGIVARDPSNVLFHHHAAVRPDDRAGIRGVGFDMQ